MGKVAISYSIHSASASSLRCLTFPPATIAAGKVVEATPGLIDAGGVKILREIHSAAQAVGSSSSCRDSSTLYEIRVHGVCTVVIYLFSLSCNDSSFNYV